MKYARIVHFTFTIFIITSVVVACESAHVTPIKTSGAITIDTMLSGKISIRALLIDDGKLWYGADNGRYGNIELKSNKNFEMTEDKSSGKPEFRSIAQTASGIFILNAGTPAQLYQISKQSKEIKLRYSESHEKTFYDSMAFWNDLEGIAIGDPVENCMSVIITRDGGNSWQKLSCSVLPPVVEGEAAFAASNTNVIVKGNHTWIVSGGKKSRVFYSSDKGRNWQVSDTPIIQGSAMTGIFSADFYDKDRGIVAGGDYDKPQQNFGNKAITKDGGKSWDLIAENSGFGYASCIQYIPNSNGNGIVSVGASGLWRSDDGGKNWKQLLKDDSLYTIRFLNENTAFAAGRNKIIRIRF